MPFTDTKTNVMWPVLLTVTDLRDQDLEGPLNRSRAGERLAGLLDWVHATDEHFLTSFRMYERAVRDHTKLMIERVRGQHLQSLNDFVQDPRKCPDIVLQYMHRRTGAKDIYALLVEARADSNIPIVVLGLRHGRPGFRLESTDFFEAERSLPNERRYEQFANLLVEKLPNTYDRGPKDT